MLSIHTTRRNLKTQQSPDILDLCLRKTWMGKSHDYRDAIVFEKFRFKNVFRPHENEKLRFRDGLVWTVGLTVEIKLRVQISPV